MKESLMASGQILLLLEVGVSNCYVFKSQLQEYAQKVGFPTPVYETIKDGPSHEPSFKSTVVVNGARYESLPGFFNRKAAEQSAAEIALMDLSKSGDTKHSIAVPVVSELYYKSKQIKPFVLRVISLDGHLELECNEAFGVLFESLRCAFSLFFSVDLSIV